MPYLTKSRFTTGIVCPVKLRYLDDARYANSMASDAFLKALADGGHQIGALAKCLHPDGVEIEALTHDEQVRQTDALLTREEVVIFEAAIRVGELFIRADILRKRGDLIELFEVKAKSYDSSEGESLFIGQRGIKSEFRTYLYDVAFQRHVLSRAFPGRTIRCYLVMPDKTRTCSEDGVAQRLTLRRTGARQVRIDIDPSLRDGRIARELLAEVPIDAYLDRLVTEPVPLGGHTRNFAEAIDLLTQAVAGMAIPPLMGAHCKDCEFYLSSAQRIAGLQDGRLTCWVQATGSRPERFERGTVYDLNGFRRAHELVANGTIALAEVTQPDLRYTTVPDAISSSERQWLQCEEARDEVTTPVLRTAELRAKLNALEPPVHFIDFETATPAIPFHKGRHPYEELWFQFSHHRLEADGRISHATQALEVSGAFPNVDTLRRLAAALGQQGSVVHWWTHEATVLKHVRDQLLAMEAAPADRDQLVAFIDSLIGGENQPGRLVDLGRHVAEKLVFLPGTRGGSSIKKVLPALLRASAGLQQRYSEPIYGTASGVPSLNYRDHAWVQRDAQGEIRDPYALLGGCFDDADLDDADDESDVIADGGQAMVAYGILLNPCVDEMHRTRLKKQLLRYCELDSFAMVIAWEGLRDLMH